MHRRTSTLSTAALLFLTSGSFAVAQPGFGPPGPPRGPGEAGGPPGDMMRMLPVMAALDKDENGEISKEEIANATAALTELDANKDGKLTFEELRPNFRGGPEGRRPEGPAGRRPEGPEGRRPEGLEGRRPEGLEGRRPEGPGDRGPGDRGPGDRGPGDRGPGDRGPGDRGPGGGPRNPEQFIQRAFEFDADKDGKLSKEELTEMLTAMGRERGEERGPERGRERGEERGSERGEERRPERD